MSSDRTSCAQPSTPLQANRGAMQATATTPALVGTTLTSIWRCPSSVRPEYSQAGRPATCPRRGGGNSPSTALRNGAGTSDASSAPLHRDAARAGPATSDAPSARITGTTARAAKPGDGASTAVCDGFRPPIPAVLAAAGLHRPGVVNAAAPARTVRGPL